MALRNRRQVVQQVEKFEPEFTNQPASQWGNLGELGDRYIQQGLNYISGAISKRDNKGNVILHEIVSGSETTNQKIYIEPVTTYYSNQSVLANIDNTFSYFEFPRIVNVSTSQIQTPDLSGIITNLQDQLFNAKFIPDPNTQWFTFSNTYQKLDFSVPLSGVNQIEPSTYRITRELIDTGRPLRFRVKIAIHNEGTSDLNFYGTLNLRAENYRPVPADVPVIRKKLSGIQYDVIQFDYTIPNSEMQENDVWEVVGYASTTSGNGRYQSAQSYWDIKLLNANETINNTSSTNTSTSNSSGVDTSDTTRGGGRGGVGTMGP